MQSGKLGVIVVVRLIACFTSLEPPVILFKDDAT